MKRQSMNYVSVLIACAVIAIATGAALAIASPSIGMHGYWAGAADGSYATMYASPTEGPVVGVSDGQNAAPTCICYIDGVPHLQVVCGKQVLHIDLVYWAKSCNRDERSNP